MFELLFLLLLLLQINQGSFGSLFYEGSTDHFELSFRLTSSHRRCSIKKGFLKNLGKSQENTCVGASFKNKFGDVFLRNLAKFLRTPFF